MRKIVLYHKDMTIKNIESMPHGLNAPYLVCLEHNGELIAKQWKRNPEWNRDETLVAFTQTAYKNAQRKNHDSDTM
jgi:hypothetical protein